MLRKTISENVKRQLIAESMGRCMNPECSQKLIFDKGNIEEKAHIIAYNETCDNSYDNLIILCPNCHKKFDKCDEFTSEELLSWKVKRREEIDKLFLKKYTRFEDLEKEVRPLLLRNKLIFDKYYLSENRVLWDKFEAEILVNNEQIKKLLSNNLELFQKSDNEKFSNLNYVQKLLLHIDEFKQSRIEKDRIREVLFPEEVNSIFGIESEHKNILPMTESLEVLIEKLKKANRFIKIEIGIERPFIQFETDDNVENLYFDDHSRLRQFFYNYKCFRHEKVRLDSLNFALKFIKDRKINFVFPNIENLRRINIKGTNIIFVYEYCLSKVTVANLGLNQGSVLVNLHNWNGEYCISSEAHEFAKTISVRLFDLNSFYKFIHELESHN